MRAEFALARGVFSLLKEKGPTAARLAVPVKDGRWSFLTMKTARDKFADNELAQRTDGGD